MDWWFFKCRSEYTRLFPEVDASYPLKLRKIRQVKAPGKRDIFLSLLAQIQRYT